MFLKKEWLAVAALRASSLGTKFLFTIVLAKFLSVSDFAQWILILAIVNYAIFLVGAEIYNITLRGFVSLGFEAVAPQLSAQWGFFCSVYVVLLATGALLSLAGLDGLPLATPLVIAAIIVLEHFSHELHRMAYFEDNQIHANVILLIKTAGWMVPISAYLLWNDETSSLQLILIAWAVGAFASACYGYFVYRNIFSRLELGKAVEYVGRWKSVIGHLTPFLVLAFALRTPLLMDRYLIELFAGRSQLAMYGYYVTFGNGVQAIFDAVILAKLIPQLLKQESRSVSYYGDIRLFLRIALAFWCLSFAGLYFLIPYFNGFIGKEEFENANGLLALLFFGQLLFSLSTVLQYGLYALHKDKQLIWGALLYLFTSIVMFFLLIPVFGSYGAAGSLAVAAAAMVLFRWWQLSRLETAEKKLTGLGHSGND